MSDVQTALAENQVCFYSHQLQGAPRAAAPRPLLSETALSCPRFLHLQAKRGCRSLRGAARAGCSGSCGEICAACIVPESLGRSLRSTASCRRETLNRGSRAIAHYEMLHSGGAELACAVLHCRERQSCSKKQLSLTMDVNSTRLLYCEALLKN